MIILFYVHTFTLPPLLCCLISMFIQEKLYYELKISVKIYSSLFFRSYNAVHKRAYTTLHKDARSNLCYGVGRIISHPFTCIIVCKSFEFHVSLFFHSAHRLNSYFSLLKPCFDKLKLFIRIPSKLM